MPEPYESYRRRQSGNSLSNIEFHHAGTEGIPLPVESVDVVIAEGVLNLCPDKPMTPIIFTCQETLPLVPRDIAGQILDLTRWPGFHGYGPIPGIKAAECEVRTPGTVGTRIRVTNRDGSSHVEEIVEWQPEQRVRLEMKEFSPPLSRLASRFEETWEFTSTQGGTSVTRSFRIHARSLVARLPLWVIAFFLKRAIARHLREMKTSGVATK